jgi:hypothetical protein
MRRPMAISPETPLWTDHGRRSSMSGASLRSQLECENGASPFAGDERGHMNNATLLAGFGIALCAVAQPTAPQSDSIAAAVLPLPEALRNAAGVVRLDADLQPITLRKAQMEWCA